MPDFDNAVPSRSGHGVEPAGLSRRSMLRGAAGMGAAGIAAGVLAGGALPAAAQTNATAGSARGAGLTRAGAEPVVVHVRDVAAGEMDVFRGTTHTRVRDRELAARLVRAVG
jgi:hypothetical protein